MFSSSINTWLSIFFTIGFFGLFIVLRQILFFGFAPFLPSHPEKIEQILKELRIKDDFTICSLGSGRCGFLRIIEKKFPKTKLIGFEEGWFSYFLSKLQVCLICSRIKIVHKSFYQADISRANIVYCYLEPNILREIYKKLKIEPRADATIISTGFIVPYLKLFKVIEVKEKKRWFNFFSNQKKILTVKEKEYKRDNNVYFYEV